MQDVRGQGPWEPPPMTLRSMDLTLDDLETLILANPNLRGPIFGYAAEPKAIAQLEAKYLKRFKDFGKPDDHDRNLHFDRLVGIDGHLVRLEVKSLQTASIRQKEDGGPLRGSFQVDASDKREVTLSDGSTVTTTALVRGGFDVVAINMFAAFGSWRFAYCAERDLPSSKMKRLNSEQRSQLLQTSVQIVIPWPKGDLQEPFSWSFKNVVDGLLISTDLDTYESNIRSA